MQALSDASDLIELCAMSIIHYYTQRYVLVLGDQ